VLNLAQSLHKQASARVSTGDLNRVLRAAVAHQAPPMRQNRRPKIYYATQVASNPPTVVLFTNGPELFDNTYQRYLLKTLRDQLPFAEVPIKLYLRHKHREDRPPEDPHASVADLPFRTTVSDEEIEREGKHYESELWKDI
jgi:GTP-binding protein